MIYVLARVTAVTSGGRHNVLSVQVVIKIIMI